MNITPNYLEVSDDRNSNGIEIGRFQKNYFVIVLLLSLNISI